MNNSELTAAETKIGQLKNNYHCHPLQKYILFGMKSKENCHEHQMPLGKRKKGQQQ